MPIGWGFDYGAFDTALFDEVGDETTFSTYLLGEFVKPLIRFLYGSSDRSAYLIEVSNITREPLAAGTASVVLDNSTGLFDVAFLDTDNGMGTECQIDVCFVDRIEYLRIFTGKIRGVNCEGTRIHFHLQDTTRDMLNKMVTWPFYGAGIYSYTPADIVWTVLTLDGGLDDTEDTSNLDIDYTSWLNWKTYCTDNNYFVSCDFKEQTIRNILELAAELSDSYIATDTSNKFIFAPPFSTGLLTLTATNCEIMNIRYDTDWVANDVTVNYGYNPLTNEWAGSATSLIGASEDKYGRREKLFDSKYLWHLYSELQDNFYTNYTTEHDNARKIYEIKAFLGAYTIDLLQAITVQDLLRFGAGTRTIRVIRINSIDLNNGTIEFDAILVP